MSSLRQFKEKFLEARSEENLRSLNEIPKIEKAIDNLILKICKPFEEKGQNLRYKHRDYVGWEADLALKESNLIIAHYEKKIAKNKKLKPKDLLLIKEIGMVVSVIQQKQIGNNQVLAKSLESRISDFPSSEKQHDINLESIAKILEEGLKGLK